MPQTGPSHSAREEFGAIFGEEGAGTTNCLGICPTRHERSIEASGDLRVLRAFVLKSHRHPTSHRNPRAIPTMADMGHGDHAGHDLKMDAPEAARPAPASAHDHAAKVKRARRGRCLRSGIVTVVQSLLDTIPCSAGSFRCEVLRRNRHRNFSVR